MSFLTPWFLLGGLAIAGPILFHLIRRAARERTLFSSLMFLRPTPPRLTRRSKLEHLWLLLLRCLALLLLAAGFARPFFAHDQVAPAATSEARQLVLLIDTSASMRRDGLSVAARAAAETYLDHASPADQIAVLTFDRQPRTLVSFAEWTSWPLDERASLARQRLAVLPPPAWTITHLGLALTTAAEQINDDSDAGKPPARREVILISDLQEGAKLDGLQGHDWPAGVTVQLQRLDPKHPSNAGIEVLAEPGLTAGASNTVSVRIANARDSTREKFRIGWTADPAAGLAASAMEIYLPPGQTRTFAVGQAFQPAGSGDFPVARQPDRNRQTGMSALPAGQLRLEGDDESFDNVSYYAAPEIERVTIAYFGTESANDPEKLRYYLQRAFPETPRRQVQFVRPTTNTTFSAERLEPSTFAVIAGPLAADEAAAVHAWLARGRTALLVLTDVQMGPALAAVAGLPELQLTEARGEYALLGAIDFTHPVFAPFADPRFSDFTHIHFWKHRRWEIPPAANAQVLASFDDGSPALAQLPVGSGRLLVLAAGWNPVDSQLAVSSKFPPLLHRMLDWSGAGLPTRYQFLTGDPLPSPVGQAFQPAGSGDFPVARQPDRGLESPGNRQTGMSASPAVEWQKPDGKKQSLPSGTAFTETDLPGIYTATFDGKPRHYAVNLSLDESRTAPLAPDELARLGVPLQLNAEPSAALTQTRQRHLQQAELESRQKLWRWLIAGVLAITFGEILLGGWLARRVNTVEAPAA